MTRDLSAVMQRELELRNFIKGQLFSEYFLLRGIKELDIWNQISDDEVRKFLYKLVDIYGRIDHVKSLPEADVEDSIIDEILSQVGFYYIRQRQASKYRPDYALFINEEEWRTCREQPDGIFWLKADCILEAKRGNRNLDARNPKDAEDPNNPSNKIVSYLEEVWRATNRKVRFAFLTNGREWRVYAREIDLRSKRFLSFELEEFIKWILQKERKITDFISNENTITVSDLLRLILFFLRPEAHHYQIGIEKKCILDIALAEGKLWERRITDALKNELFEEIIPQLANGMAKSFDNTNGEKISTIYRCAIIFLYRLLVVLHAEDRNILPIHGTYHNYSLQKIRLEVAQHADQGKSYSSSQYLIYDAIQSIFRILNEGDLSLQVSAYNGHLFDNSQIPELDQIQITDEVMASVIDRISRDRSNQTPDLLWINYAELSVKHLGNIYESLLRFHLKKADVDLAIVKENGNASERIVPITKVGSRKVVKTIKQDELYLVDDNDARKATGSYFTPDYIVRFIVEETIGSTLSKIKSKFLSTLEELNANENLDTKAKIQQIQQVDPLQKMLNLRILDPAMGSGHFLVTVYETLKEWSESILGEDYKIDDNYYVFEPLKTLKDPETDPLSYIERLIVKRCLYGVDINPLSVELAKVSIWLSSFKPESPLTFLDHHLRVGNSLLGITWKEFQQKKRLNLFSYLKDTVSVKDLINRITESADLDTKSVRESEQAHKHLETLLYKLKIISHLRLWVILHPSARDRTVREKAQELIENFLNKQEVDPSDPTVQIILKEADQEKFFHWDLEFIDLAESSPNKLPRFDFVVTNPPYGGMVSSLTKSFYKTRYHTHKETAAYFMSKILQTCNKYGIILPKTLAFYSKWSALRDLIFNQSYLQHVMDTGLAFEDVNLETIILIGIRKGKSTYSNYLVSVAQPLRSPIPHKTIIEEGKIPFDLISDSKTLIFRGISDDELQVLKIIRENSFLLKDIVGSQKNIFRGVYIPDKIKKEVIIDRTITVPLKKLPKNHFIWINKVPDVKKYQIVRYHEIDLSNSAYAKILQEVNKKLGKRLLFKVLRGDRLISFPENSGTLSTTEKLVNVVLPKKCQYTLNFLCGVINSPYPSFYLANTLFSKTTETSRIMDFAYSSLIPIPKINFTLSDTIISHLRTSVSSRIDELYRITNDEKEFLKWIEEFLVKNVSNNRHHGMFVLIDLFVEKILHYRDSIQRFQDEFVYFISLNYSFREKKQTKPKQREMECKLMESVGFEKWSKFRKRIVEKYKIDTVDYQSLAEKYVQLEGKITQMVNIISLLEELIDQFVAKCYSLDEKHKVIVKKGLKKPTS